MSNTDTTLTDDIVTPPEASGITGTEIIVTGEAGETATLMTAEEIESNCPARLQEIGKEITARLAKADKKVQEANDHLIAVNKLLAEAKGLCDGSGFRAFCERFQIGKSRAYELLAIASGRKSEKEVKAATRKRVARHREAKRSAPSVTVTESVQAGPAEPKRAPTPPQPEAEAAAEPTVEEAEAEVKRLKAERAALKNKIDANGNGSTNGGGQGSAQALGEFRAACETLLPKMHGDDLQNAIDGFAEVVEVPAAELMPDLNQLRSDLKIAKAEITALKRKLAGKLPPRESRAAAWARLAEEAASCIEALIDYQQEFDAAREAQPESLQEGPSAQKCEQIGMIDLGSALEILQEAESADLPLEFGRD